MIRFPDYALRSLFATLLALTACGQLPEGEPPLPVEIVDLSPVITEDLPVRMFGHRALSLFGFSDRTEFRHVEGHTPMYYVNSYLTLFNHAGPHVDSPNHMAQGAKSIDTFPLVTFIGPMRLFDLRDRPRGQPLARTEFEGKGIRPGDVVVALVGYQPPSGPDDLPSFSYLSLEAAEYLASIPVRLFGTDALSVDGSSAAPGDTGYARVAPVHHAFLSRDIPVVEQLVNLDQLIGKRNPLFVGFPLKIANGNASPIRAAALVY